MAMEMVIEKKEFVADSAVGYQDPAKEQEVTIFLGQRVRVSWHMTPPGWVDRRPDRDPTEILFDVPAAVSFTHNVMLDPIHATGKATVQRWVLEPNEKADVMEHLLELQAQVAKAKAELALLLQSRGLNESDRRTIASLLANLS